jgi:glycosyltransferase involved in cell wall biosynthesis
VIRKPSILIFIDWYLPGFKAGGPIQSCANLVEHLKEQANFYIITRNTDYCSDEPYSDVISDDWNEVSGSKVHYVSKEQLTYKNIKKLTAQLCPDYIYINGVYSLYFSIVPLLIVRQLKLSNAIVAARGMFAKSATDVKAIKKSVFFSVVKTLNFYKGVKFHATNAFEKADIENVLGKGSEVKIAPNLPKKQLSNNNASRLKNKGELKLISVARIAPEKNTKYAIDILSAYKGSGTIYFDLFGPLYDLAYWKECEAVIKNLPKNVVVRYMGSLEPGNVPTYLEKYHLLFMPSRGENFGHIILESLITGCPVLISDQTPWKNLQNLGIGFDHPLEHCHKFTDTIQSLVNMNQEVYNCLSNKAHSFAKSYCNDSIYVEANRALFNL